MRVERAAAPIRLAGRILILDKCYYALLLILLCIHCVYTAALQGDSGGPLTVEEDGIHTLAGITSYRLSAIPHKKVDILKNVWVLPVFRINKGKPPSSKMDFSNF